MAVKDRMGAVIVTQNTTSYQSMQGIAAMVCSPVVQAVSMSQARQRLQQMESGIVIVNTPVQDEFGTEGAIDLVVRAQVPVILLVSADVYDNTVYRTRDSGVFVLTRPLKGQVLLETLNNCRAMQRRVDLLKKENGRLQRRLEEMSLVTRAKCILIEKEHMSEEDAHRYLETEAMNHSLTKKEVAQRIIRDIAS